MRIKRLAYLLVFGALLYFGARYFIGNEGGDYTTTGSISSNLGSQMKSSYQRFEGSKFRTIGLVQGSVLHLEAEIETDDGSLELSFIDPEGQVIYSVTNPDEMVVKDFEIGTTGEYRIQVAGDHKGSFELDWETRLKK
jgi:hypothetical protein